MPCGIKEKKRRRQMKHIMSTYKNMSKYIVLHNGFVFTVHGKSQSDARTRAQRKLLKELGHIPRFKIEKY